MTDDPYRDAALVELYDLDNPGGDDHAYYRALADEIDAGSIIDLGCGTGLLTRALAGERRTVIGVDPSRTMLDYARRQPGSGSVIWIHGDASALRHDGNADLAICTDNAIMHVSPVPWWPQERRNPTLHAVLVHEIQETARHAGHADIIREYIDGAVGLREGVSNLPADADAATWEEHYAKLDQIARSVSSGTAS
jgi:SAM-dependent methyltransferase